MLTVSSDSCWHDPIVRGGLVGAGVVGGAVGGAVGAGVVGGGVTVVAGRGADVVVTIRIVVVVGPPTRAVVVVVA